MTGSLRSGSWVFASAMLWSLLLLLVFFLIFDVSLLLPQGIASLLAASILVSVAAYGHVVFIRLLGGPAAVWFGVPAWVTALALYFAVVFAASPPIARPEVGPRAWVLAVPAALAVVSAWGASRRTLRTRVGAPSPPAPPRWLLFVAGIAVVPWLGWVLLAAWSVRTAWQALASAGI